MNTKGILAIVAVVIIVAAAGAAVFMMHGDSSKNDEPQLYDGRLMVYGNANNDDYLTADDITYLQKIIDGEVEKTTYADANQDGKIDQKDIDLVQKVLDIQSGKSTGKVDLFYYSTAFNKPMKAAYPVKNYVAIEREAMLAVKILGTMDRMVGHSGIYDSDLYSDTTSQKVGSWRSVELEAISGLNVDAVVTLDLASDITNEDELVKNGIDVIRLPVGTNDKWEYGYVTLGFFLDVEERAHEFVDFSNDVLDTIKNATKNLTDSKKQHVLTVSGTRVYGLESGFTYPIEMACGIDICDFYANTYFNPGDEWLDKYTFSYIYGVTNNIGYKVSSTDQALIDSEYQKNVNAYGVFQAIADHNCVVMNNDCPLIIKAAYLAENLYPGLISKGYGDRIHQQYVDKFIDNLSKQKYDVRTGIFCVNYGMTSEGKAADSGITIKDLADCRLLVYGNADNDDDLDADDVKLIEQIAKGVWNPAVTPYADANGDGKVDSTDVEYLQAIIAKNTSVAKKIFYTDVNGNKASVSQPVAKLGADYWPCMDGIIAIGAQNLVTHVDSGIYGQLSSAAVKYNTLTQSDVKNFGSGFGSGYDFETILSTGVDAIVCGSADIYFVGIEDLFNDKSRIDMIRLPFWEGDNVDSAIITLAYLLNDDSYIAKAKEFLAFEDKVTKTLDDGLFKVKDVKSCLVVYIGSATEASLDVEIEARGCGSFEWSVLAGLNNLSSDINKEGLLASSSMYYQTDQDYVITNNPDYVFILGRAGFNRTTADAQLSYDAGAAYLTTTKAFQNGNIWVSGSGVTSGTMQKVLALLLASEVYTKEFQSVNVDALMQEYVDRFTLANDGVASTDGKYFDVTKSGVWIYNPTPLDVYEQAKKNVTDRLFVYGNANNDDNLDMNDVRFLEYIIETGLKVDTAMFPFCDVNQDGNVNSADVDYLKGILAGESCLMYYKDFWGTVSYVHYPITGNLGANYSYGLNIGQTLGVYDRFTAAIDSVINNYSETLFPGCKSLKNLGSDKDTAAFIEQLIDKDVACVIGFYDKDLNDMLVKGTSGIDVINLAYARASSTDDPVSSLLTTAALLGRLDEAHAFANDYDKVCKTITEAVATLETEKTAIIAFNPGNPTTVGVDTYGADGTQLGDAWVIFQLPLIDNADHSQSAYVQMQIESANITDADYIFVCLSTSALALDTTIEEGQAKFDEKCAFLKGTKAYAEKHIIGVGFTTIGTYMGLAQLGLLANAVWPDLIDEDYGYSVLKEFYSNYGYLPEDYDLTQSGFFHVYTMA
ncbi:MAG: ABC transporter substrate-binding protein [archaeon]|nr:ABC transporter substrate-binding protein [archaeon]